MPQSDERVPAVLCRRQHRVVAAAQPARGAPQVCRREDRAIGADQDRGPLRSRQRVVHALAEILAALDPEGDTQPFEKTMSPRAVEFDYLVSKPGGAQRVQGQAFVKTRGAPFPQPRSEPRLRPAEHRGSREHDDQR